MMLSGAQEFSYGMCTQELSYAHSRDLLHVYTPELCYVDTQGISSCSFLYAHKRTLVWTHDISCAHIRHLLCAQQRSFVECTQERSLVCKLVIKRSLVCMYRRDFLCVSTQESSCVKRSLVCMHAVEISCACAHMRCPGRMHTKDRFCVRAGQQEISCLHAHKGFLLRLARGPQVASKVGFSRERPERSTLQDCQDSQACTTAWWQSCLSACRGVVR